MEDRPNPRQAARDVLSPLSRRQFLTLSTLMAWPFHGRANASPYRVALNSLPADEESINQLVVQEETTATQSLANAVVIKSGNVCFLTDADGSVPFGGEHGFGLYYHDCRFLSGYDLRLSGRPPLCLCGTTTHGFMAKFELTNPKLTMKNGGVVEREALSIQWQRMVDGSEPALHDQLVIQNFGRQVADFALSFKFRTAFEDVYAVRGFRVQQLGVLHEPAWRNDALYFFYAGKDGLYRSLAVHFSVRPQRVDGGRVFFRIKLRPREATQLLVSFVVSESHEVRAVSPRVHSPNFGELKSALQDSSEAWLASVTRITSDNPILEQVIRRSMLDLHLLQSNIEDHTFLIAGMPWYATLFGRDSLLGALQILAYDPSIAEQTLRLLAKYQGQREDEWRDEQPGKIPHELRQGELAHLGMIPHTPYYGTIDATPLFLILLGQHAAWTGTLALFHELRGSVERALEWMATYGDRHGTSYLAYESRSQLALTNQGWKDSGEAIVNTDGSLAQPPIALVEVQGYVYLAKLVIADLYDRIGEPMPARRLREEAGRLRSRFNRDFWLEAKRCYALALQRDDKPAAVVASNAGQVLWTGIADAGKAGLTVDRLMAPDMFNGWGIRTLSENEQGYSPIGYHIGTVWPHDNSLIAAGFRRYGHDRAACRIFTGLLDAAMHLKAYRLPELFAGYSRASYEVPVVYAAANPPQAWAACAMPYFIQTLLGLRAEGLDRRLRILRPVLPDGIDELEVHGLRVGRGTVDLQFMRTKDSAAHVRTLRVEGPLEVVVEPKTSG